MRPQVRQKAVKRNRIELRHPASGRSCDLPLQESQSRIRLGMTNPARTDAKVRHLILAARSSFKHKDRQHPTLYHFALDVSRRCSHASRYRGTLADFVLKNPQGFVQRSNYKIDCSVANGLLLRCQVGGGGERRTSRNVSGNRHGAAMGIQFPSVKKIPAKIRLGSLMTRRNIRRRRRQRIVEGISLKLQRVSSSEGGIRCPSEYLHALDVRHRLARQAIVRSFRFFSRTNRISSAGAAVVLSFSLTLPLPHPFAATNPFDAISGTRYQTSPNAFFSASQLT